MKETTIAEKTTGPGEIPTPERPRGTAEESPYFGASLSFVLVGLIIYVWQSVMCFFYISCHKSRQIIHTLSTTGHTRIVTPVKPEIILCKVGDTDRHHPLSFQVAPRQRLHHGIVCIKPHPQATG